jgi:hypothetical protein
MSNSDYIAYICSEKISIYEKTNITFRIVIFRSKSDELRN